ncbi:N-formylglutamate amidohydrolase [Aliihoeflea sp. PC F10.4]
MTKHPDFTGHPPFETSSPAFQSVPFIFNSPHSGAFYPPRFLEMARLDAHAIRRSEDCFVDDLFASVVEKGAPLLKAHFPRAYLDVNREPWELDPRMFTTALPPFANTRSARVAGGLGTIPRLVGEGQDIYAGKLSLDEAAGRIEGIYKPYHDQLRALIGATYKAFGMAVLVDCHSMPASIRLAESRIRPDFIIGDRYGMSCMSDLSETAIAYLAGCGYTVAHNKPYAGGFITEHYGRPARGIHAIQIEINRSLYMDEDKLLPHEGYDQLRRDIDGLAATLIDLFSPPAELPVAAE